MGHHAHDLITLSKRSTSLQDGHRSSSLTRQLSAGKLSYFVPILDLEIVETRMIAQLSTFLKPRRMGLTGRPVTADTWKQQDQPEDPARAEMP
jgi:hypothetical protein